MSDLSIDLTPERLDEGTAEERSTFGLFSIRSGAVSLTEGFDFFLNGGRRGPLVAGYHIAEWFAWNWWRLLHEPRSRARDWYFAHNTSSIGEGFFWPNITIFSDGERTALISQQSPPDTKPFRYFGAPAVVVPTRELQNALDVFIPQMVSRAASDRERPSNLERVWNDVLLERQDGDLAVRRRLEALLGLDPDQATDNAIDVLLADARVLGLSAVDEIAAESGRMQAARASGSHDINTLATRDGYEASSADAFRFKEPLAMHRANDIAAWKIGQTAAQSIRKQLALGSDPISDEFLSDLLAVTKQWIDEEPAESSHFSFFLDTGEKQRRVYLRSRWKTGRRFDLARLLGDSLVGIDEPLHPATHAYTYRQKMQRSFAAELLSPFEAVDEMIGTDYSEDHQQDVAARFCVSPLAITTILRNHGRLPHDDFEDYQITREILEA